MLRYIKQILFTLFLSLNILVYSQGDYKVDLKINNLDDTIIYIKQIYGNETLILDTIIKRDGVFRFEKKGVKPGIVMACLKHEDLFSFVLDKSKEFSLEISPSGNAIVLGCEENDLFFEFQRANMEFRVRENEIKQALENKSLNKDSLMREYSISRKKFGDFQQSFYSTYPNNIMTIVIRSLEDPQIPKQFYKGKDIDTTKIEEASYYFRTHYWDNFHFEDSRLLSTPYFFSKLKSYMESVTIMLPDSISTSIRDFVLKANSYPNGHIYSKFVVDYYLSQYRNIPFSWHEENYVSIVDKVVSPELTPWIPSFDMEIYKREALYLKKILPDSKFPIIKGEDLKGKIHSIDDIKKKYKIVHFFSASCGSCKIDLDKFENFHKEFSKEFDFDIISVDLDYNEDNSIEFNKARPFAWNKIKATPEDIINAYGIDVFQTPDIYVLDNENIILYHAPKYQSIIDYIKKSEELSKEHKGLNK